MVQSFQLTLCKARQREPNGSKLQRLGIKDPGMPYAKSPPPPPSPLSYDVVQGKIKRIPRVLSSSSRFWSASAVLHDRADS